MTEVRMGPAEDGNEPPALGSRSTYPRRHDKQPDSHVSVPDGEGIHVGHGHDHSRPIEMPPSARRKVRLILAALVIPLIVATVVGMVVLWPGQVAQRGSQPFLSAGQETAVVTVTAGLGACDVSALDGAELENLLCARVEGDSTGSGVLVHVPPEIKVSVQPGDRLRVVHYTQAQATGFSYFYLDGERQVPLVALLLVYLVVVLAVALKRGLLAMIGLAVSVATLVFFLVPALMNGKPPLLTTLTAVSAMIVASVYVAHGVSIKTTTALLGTYFGLAITTVGAMWATRSLLLTGTSDDIQNLHASLPQVSLSALMTCGIMIAGLGALNDVTITQASAVWELYESNPQASAWSVFLSAMRIGRDHIASTVYTLAFAYAGTALPLLMLVMLVDRPVWGIITSGQIAEELARTLVASIGLVVAIPLTTLIGAVLVPAAAPTRRRSSVTRRG